MFRTRPSARFVVAIFLALALLATRPGTERYGDTLQIALPIAGLGCALAGGGSGAYFKRFAGMWVTMRGTKIALGDAAINARPTGGDRGFPSGHTAAATFGASALVNTCLANAPLFQTVVIVAAAFVGGSRIDQGRHNVWQVLAGAILAILFDRGFRRATSSWRAWRRSCQWVRIVIMKSGRPGLGVGS